MAKKPTEPKPRERKKKEDPKPKGQRGRPRKEKDPTNLPPGTGRGRGRAAGTSSNDVSKSMKGLAVLKNQRSETVPLKMDPKPSYNKSLVSYVNSESGKVSKGDGQMLSDCSSPRSESSVSILRNQSGMLRKEDDPPQQEEEKPPPVQLQPLTKELADQFIKLNQQTIAWQQSQLLSSKPKGADTHPVMEEYLVKDTFVTPYFQVHIVEYQWLTQVRAYASAVHKLYLQFADESQKSAKAKAVKRKGQTVEQYLKGLQKKLNQGVQDAMNDFASLSQPLTNMPLVHACSSFQREPSLFYFQSNDQNCNVFLKQNISVEKDYGIILPALYEFLAQHREVFNIHNSDYFVPVTRKYRRLDGRNALKAELELHLVRLDVRKGDQVVVTQIPVDLVTKQVQARVMAMLQDQFKEPKADYALVFRSGGNLTELKPDKLEFMHLFPGHLKDKSKAVQIEAITRAQASQLNLQQPKGVHLNCNFCRNSLKVKTRKVRQCHCRMVSYCNQKCFQLDRPFHREQCLIRIQSLEDWDYDRTDVSKLQPQYFNRQGLIGLLNISNSCYMNCTIQCLSHCRALSNYFLRGCFLEELNLNNPLGSQGMLAVAFGQLIKQLWSGEAPVVLPLNFKSVLGRFKKQFANAEQQDSQEFLTIILDSLHEDLNRVKVKPLVPTMESHGEDDEKASLEAWEAHLKRSQSIIVDLMHGQFKSTVRCPEPECNHLSITFEPFMNISLPIPEIKMVTKHFIWVPNDFSQKCSIHQFTIKSHETIKNLRKFIIDEILAKQAICCENNSFEIVLIQADKVKRIMSYQNQVSGLNLQDTHLFVYESPQAEQEDDNKLGEADQDNSMGIPIVKEISSRVKKENIMTVLNFQIINYGFNMEQSNTRMARSQSLDEVRIEDCETYFPRITHLNLDASLIQIHLQIFDKLKFIFSRFLELRDWYHHNNVGGYQTKLPISGSIEDSLFFQKMSMKIPLHLSLEKWNRMSLTEQYEIVFSSQQNFQDPSRRKPQDLPYFVRLVSRKARSQGQSIDDQDISGLEQSRESHETSKSQSKRHLKCIYCLRKTCNGCPLPFNDKISLRDFLLQRRAPVHSVSYFQDDDTFNQTQLSMKQKQKQMTQKQQMKQKKTGKGEEVGKVNDEVNEDVNMDLEFTVQFNRNNCWGLHELLIRGQNQKSTFINSIQKLKLAKSENELNGKAKEVKKDDLFIDKVTITDCFRQFDTPEKLSWQNEWYCDQCKQHKQAVKKIQVYKTPPILIITLKRFKGQMTNQKQNTPVYYPIEGLNMKDFMIPTQTQDQLYDLFAVVNHTGTLNGGHYTAIAKNYVDEEWYDFNDHQVSKIIKSDTQKLISNNAYILFYQKRGIDFKNIVDYTKIRNQLQQINGKERFIPESIVFPSVETIPTSAALVAKHGSKSQMEMFDEPMLSGSSSFKEIKYEDKLTYIEWIEREFDLNKESESQEVAYDISMVEEDPTEQELESSESSQETVVRKREVKQVRKSLILSKQTLGLDSVLPVRLSFGKEKVSKVQLKQVLNRLIKINKESIGQKKQKQLCKLYFNEFLEGLQKHRGRKKAVEVQPQKIQCALSDQGHAKNSLMLYIPAPGFEFDFSACGYQNEAVDLQTLIMQQIFQDPAINQDNLPMLKKRGRKPKPKDDEGEIQKRKRKKIANKKQELMAIDEQLFNIDYNAEQDIKLPLLDQIYHQQYFDTDSIEFEYPDPFHNLIHNNQQNFQNPEIFMPQQIDSKPTQAPEEQAPVGAKRKPSTTKLRQRRQKQQAIIDKGGMGSDGIMQLPLINPVSDQVVMKQHVRKYRYARKLGGGKNQVDKDTFGEFEKPIYMDESDHFYQQHEYHNLASFEVPHLSYDHDPSSTLHQPWMTDYRRGNSFYRQNEQEMQRMNEIDEIHAQVQARIHQANRPVQGGQQPFINSELDLLVEGILEDRQPPGRPNLR